MADLYNDGGILAVSKQNTSLVASFYGLNLTTKEIALYRMLLPTAGAMTKSVKAFDGTMPEFSVVKAVSGSNSGVVRGNYADPEMEMSIEIREDFNGIGLTSDNKSGVSKDLIQAIFKGQTFKHGSDLIRVVSVNGSVIERKKAQPCELNREFGNLLAYETKNLFDGSAMKGSKIALKTNFYDESYKAFSNAVMLESAETLGSRAYTLRIANYYPTVESITENDASENTIQLGGMKCGEFWSAGNFFMDGLVSEGDTDLEKINYTVDYVVVNATDPTDFGTSGEKAIIIDPTTGAFTIKETNGTDTWTAVSTGTFKAGQGRVFSTKFVVGATVASATTQNTFVSVKTAGADNSGVASNFAYNSAIIEEAETGSIPSPIVVPSNFICKCYEYDRNTEAFVATVATATCI